MASEWARNLEALPSEVIGQCFSQFSSSKEDIKNIRLVSKRCCEIVSPFLIDFVRVFIGSQSLERFETFSTHPVFSKSIRAVEFNVSYFDTVLATSLSIYGRNCGTNLFQKLEGHERWGDGEVDTAPLHNTVDQWEAVPNEGFDRSNCSERQKFLWLAHQEYCRRWEDQEDVKRGGMHVTRITEALSRFGNIRSVLIDDSPYYGSGEGPFVFTSEPGPGFENRVDERFKWQSGSAEEEAQRRLGRKVQKRMFENYGEHAFSDKGLMKQCLRASEWKGTFHTWDVTVPPVELIWELFGALSKASIQPSKFEISFTPPNDLRCLQLTESQQDTLRSVLRKSQELIIRVKHWARRSSLAENNSRSHIEMLSLCSLTSAFFSSENLVCLDLSFDDYPVFYEIPHISLSEILPLTTLWKNLREIDFRHIPFRIAELEALVQNVKGTLDNLILKSPYLLDRSWAVPLDILRGLEKLQGFEFEYPQGGEFGNGNIQFDNFPTTETIEYVLKLRERNPVLDYTWETR